MTLEKKIQTKIIKYLENLQKEGYPIFFDRRVVSGGSYKKGIPDLYCVYNGIHIEIEVKQEKGELSVMQEKWKDRFAKWNIKWINPKSFDEFLIEFEKII